MEEAEYELALSDPQIDLLLQYQRKWSNFKNKQIKTLNSQRVQY